MRKTSRQLADSTSQPPRNGPSAPAMPPSPDQAPIDPAPVLLSERRLEDRQTPGGEQGATDALEGARRHENSDVGREPAQQRRGGEPHDADDEHPSPAETVTRGASEQDERGQRQRVGVDRPLETGEVRAQVLADHRERHVDHRGIEEGHAGAENRGREDPASRRLVVGKRGGRRDRAHPTERSTGQPRAVARASMHRITQGRQFPRYVFHPMPPSPCPPSVEAYGRRRVP